MVRILVVLVITLLACGCLWAEPADVPARVIGILAAITPDDPATWAAAEKQLMDAELPLSAVQEALKNTSAEMQKTAQPADLQRLRLAAGVLGSAITRRQWQWDPREKIAAWITHLQAGGDPYALPAAPVCLSDPALIAVFPTYAFYAARCPDAGRPLPLREKTLFAVCNDGTLKSLTTPQDLEAFFQAQTLAAGEDAEDQVTATVAAWLRLTQELDQDGSFCFLPPANLKADYRDSALASMSGWRASGQITMAPGGKFTGSISVNLTFNAGGELKTVNEVRNITAVTAP